ncbi:hypothetical protein L6452_24113 [Arctium lappa]|uniref:Uncharacterized protein n=1 Tax=Arctium lappa TaxID=4217 RepID=A0ACB9A8U7_ARCLA|nr:hypothetical protein L6452_24113 [Arctium lappa]
MVPAMICFFSRCRLQRNSNYVCVRLFLALILLSSFQGIKERSEGIILVEPGLQIWCGLLSLSRKAGELLLRDGLIAPLIFVAGLVLIKLKWAVVVALGFRLRKSKRRLGRGRTMGITFRRSYC